MPLEKGRRLLPVTIQRTARPNQADKYERVDILKFVLASDFGVQQFRRAWHRFEATQGKETGVYAQKEQANGFPYLTRFQFEDSAKGQVLRGKLRCEEMQPMVQDSH